MIVTGVGLLLSLLITVSANLLAAEITLVYPRAPVNGGEFRYPADLDSSFVFGRISPPTGTLLINGMMTPYEADGAFLAFLPIQSDGRVGAWTLILTEAVREIARTRFEYAIEAPSSERSVQRVKLKHPQVVTVQRENARCLTGDGGTYFLFPEIGCQFLVIARYGPYFEFSLSGGLTGLIDTSAVSLTPDSVLQTTRLGSGLVLERDGLAEVRFKLSRPVPWMVTQTNDQREIRVQLFDALSAVERIRYHQTKELLAEVRWEQNSAGVELKIQCLRAVSGFDLEYGQDSLQIHLRVQSPRASRSLRGRVIVVDPGHGGSVLGAIGPLGTQEKDVNLRWSKILETELVRAGADVHLTRSDDRDVDLYDRIELGRKVGADFFLSLHCNALPDGENPALRRGTGTYYYQSASRRAAKVIHRHALGATRLNNDGLFYANFAVVRPTLFPAVLLEAAYIMHPNEERLLASDAFLKRLSKAVVAGLKEYFAQEK